MLTLITAFLKTQALPWLLSNWKHLGWPLACIFAMLYFRSCGQLAELSKPKQAEQAQSLTATAKAASTGKVTIPGRDAMPCPPSKTCPECPSVTVDFGSSAEVATHSSQSQDSGNEEIRDNFSFALGTGVWFAPQTVPHASILLNYKDFTATGQLGLGRGELIYGATGYWTVLRTHFP